MRGSLRLDYKMSDDYGVVGANAIFTLKDTKDEESNGKPAHPLFGAPEFKLTLPHARTRAGAAQTTHDLTAHPWAGAEVSVQLVARDEAGNEGRSKSVDFTLPQRIFVKPIARALIEQRRILALDANQKPLVLTALDALTIAPEKFTPDVSIYLGLRSIYFDLKHARTDPALREVVARMWDMAVQIEDGNVSKAEQALRQAQDALRQALERGASDQELKKLMEQLRAAMDKFMQALAEQMRKNPQQLARPLDRNSRTLRPQDLNQMLDRLERLARSGQRDAARRLLDQMQSMLENLQMAQPGQMDEGEDEMELALNELSDMIRKQQQLRDRTYKQGQNNRRDRQRGQRGQQQFGDLQQDQQALRERLNKLLEQLRKNGLGNMPQPGQGQKPGQNGPLGQAGKEMGKAQGELGAGRRGRRRRLAGARAGSHAQGRTGDGAVDAAERLRAGTGSARPPRARPRAAGYRSAGAADARPRIQRRRHREGAGRDRRPARAPDPEGTAQALRRKLSPADRARLHRAPA